MEFEAVILLLLGMTIGIGIVLLYAWYQFQLLKQQLDEIIHQTVVEQSTIELDLEVDQDQYFCYNSKDKQFICQGKTATEIRNAFRARFPDKRAFLVGGDPTTIAKFKAELEDNENSSSI